jgi:hypothetical protein
MGTSYVEFCKKGYWTHDAFLEVLSYLLAREFEQLPNRQNWQNGLIDSWTNAATMGVVGCVPSYFENFDTHGKVQILRQVLICIQQQLQTNPHYLTLANLADNNIGHGWRAPLDVKPFLRIVQLTLGLIDGQMATDETSPIDYWDVD